MNNQTFENMPEKIFVCVCMAVGLFLTAYFFSFDYAPLGGAIGILIAFSIIILREINRRKKAANIVQG